MEWMFASVVLVLVVISPGFRIAVFGLAALFAMLVAVLFAYDRVYLRPKREQTIRHYQRQSDLAEQERQAESEVRQSRERQEKRRAEEARQKDIQYKRIRDKLSRDLLSLDDLVTSEFDLEKGSLGRYRSVTKSTNSIYSGLYQTDSLFDYYRLKGRIKNNSSRYDLRSVRLDVTVKDCQEACEIIATASANTNVPIPHRQSRDVALRVDLPNTLDFKGAPRITVALSDPLAVVTDDLLFDADSKSTNAPSGSVNDAVEEQPPAPEFFSAE